MKRLDNRVDNRTAHLFVGSMADTLRRQDFWKGQQMNTMCL